MSVTEPDAADSLPVAEPGWPPASRFARDLLALEADPAFQALQRSQTRTNMFTILGTTDRERWHSAFWAWLLDPEGSHGLGDFGAKRLLLHVLDGDGNVRGRTLHPLRAPGEAVNWEIGRASCRERV